MLDHHLQRTIVYRLAFADGLRFTELKPDTVENKLFTYHLKKVETAGYVAKSEDGRYTLTPEGRRLGIRVLDKQQALIDQAESVLFLVIRRAEDGAWLLYRRNTHPLINRVGFMHSTPNALEDSPLTAAAACLAKTGLTASFEVMGSGYFRVYDQDNLESFTNFTLLHCADVSGELAQNDEYADYFWETDPDFSDPAMLPNMPTLAALYNQGELFFVEKRLDS